MTESIMIRRRENSTLTPGWWTLGLSAVLIGILGLFIANAGDPNRLNPKDQLREAMRKLPPPPLPPVATQSAAPTTSPPPPPPPPPPPASRCGALGLEGLLLLALLRHLR